jgi:aromatic ring-opening dioxygenase catalytic subunit (LigB family)
MQPLRTYLEGLGMLPPVRPEAVLVVSAHWEAPVPTVQTASHPSMLYDYYGFPPEAYEIQWPAPGAPQVAAAVREHLDKAGIRSADDAERGFDHGTFVVTGLAYPQADIPTFQLSLQQGLDPATHLAIGRALAPLRDQGVLILGSGLSYHNMQGFRAAMSGGLASVVDDSRAFDGWLAESMALEASRRETQLVEWAQAPRARACHPREEHLLPLMVVAGAGGEDAASLPFRGDVMGLATSAVQFG